MSLSREELSALKPLVVAVVGPTNEGKTSLLRTLTNDPDFGHVNAFTGTTVRAEIQKVFYRGIVEILQLIDTPGFQTSSEILEIVCESPDVVARGGSFDLEDVVRAIPLDDEDFRHDLRAWREIERCDVVVFVANAAEDPNKSLLKSTLNLLRHIGKPTLVAFNNVSSETSEAGSESGETGDGAQVSDESATESVQGASGESTCGPLLADYQKEWDAVLRRNSFFLSQRFDAHRRSFQDEIAFFEKLVALAQEPTLQRALRLEIDERRARERRRLADSCAVLAEMLLDVAAYQEVATNVELAEWKSRQEQLERKLRETVLQREHKAQSAMLEIWGFHFGMLQRETLVVSDDPSERDDLFDHDVKKRGAWGAGVGAAIGAIADVASAGLSFGTGLTIGAFIGGLVGGGYTMAYNSKYDKKRKRLSTRVQKNVVEALTSRGVDLIRKLESRGKAMEDTLPATLNANPGRVELPELARILERFARSPEYSSLNTSQTPYVIGGVNLKKLPGVAFLSGEEYKTREEAIQIVADELLKAFPRES